jgi:hypothetical protein
MNVAREVAAPWADHCFKIENVKTFCHAFSKQERTSMPFMIDFLQIAFCTTTKTLYSIGCKVIFRIGQPSQYYS